MKHRRELGWGTQHTLLKRVVYLLLAVGLMTGQPYGTPGAAAAPEKWTSDSANEIAADEIATLIIGEVAKLLADDAEENDGFGTAVDISGDTLIVGAPREDTGGNNTGAAYIFQGGAGNWRTVRKIQAPDAETNDEFGYSVSISGDTVVVGAPFEDTGGRNTGAAYIFQRNQGGTDNWGQVKKIQASDFQVDDNFGWSVSISGDTIVVGAPREDTGGSNVGAAYVFGRDQGGVNNWGEVRKIQAGDKGFADQFGFSVTIDGDTIVVGAPREDSGSNDAGAAYIFERNQGGADNWGEVRKIQADETGLADQFGTVVSIGGDTIVVGVPFEDSGGINAGAAYIFQRNQGGAGNWGQVHKIQASDAQANDQFGFSAHIDGGQIVVGAPLQDTGGSNAGAAYIFQRDEGGTDTWGEVEKIEASDAQANDLFGRAVSISSDTVVVGAWLEDSGGSDAGAAYVFGNTIAGPPAPPNLTVEKTANVAEIDEGGTVNYTIVVANVGQISATNVSVSTSSSSPLIDSNVLALGETLAAGETVTYTYSSTAVDGPDTLINTARVSSNQTPPITDSAGVQVNNIAPTVTAGGPQAVTAGNRVTVTATFSDPGRADTHSATVEWRGGVTTAAVIDGNTVSASRIYNTSGAYIVQICVTDKDNGQGCDALSMRVDDVPISGLNVENDSPTLLGQSTAFTATITGGTGVSYSWDFGDGNTGSGAQTSHTYAAPGVYTAALFASQGDSVDIIETTITVLDPVVLTVEKSVEPASPVTPGSLVTYTVNLRNVGSAVAEGVSFFSVVPLAVIFGEFLEAPSSVELSGVSKGEFITWEGDVAPNSTVSFVYNGFVIATPGERVSSEAGFSYGSTTGSATAEIIVVGRPVLDIWYTISPSVVNEGDTFTQTVEVVNNGEGPATNVSVRTDVLLAEGITLAAGQRALYTFTDSVDDGPTAFGGLAIAESPGVDAAIAGAEVEIRNVAPTATLTNNGPVDDGSSAVVSFSEQRDPSTADTNAGFRYSYDFDNDGIFDVSNVADASITVPAEFLTGVSSRTVLARIADKDGGFTDYTTIIEVNDPDPVGTVVDSCGGYTVYLSPEGTFFAPDWDGDIQVGNNLGNTLTGTDGPDLILGLGGNDLIIGLSGDDVLCGGDGVDLILGFDGNDYIDGGNGSDVLNGGGGEYDQLIGGDGNDTLLDGNGTLIAAGGNGRDRFTIVLREGWRDPQGQARFSGLSAGYDNDDVVLVSFTDTPLFVDITGDERDEPAAQQEGNNDWLFLFGAVDSASNIIKFEQQIILLGRSEIVIPADDAGAEYLTEPVGDGAEEAAMRQPIFLPLINR
ncbi:PKD domain-containing protein [bacterium]|nr:PKD domain-containing protein [bacterium]